MTQEPNVDENFSESATQETSSQETSTQATITPAADMQATTITKAGSLKNTTMLIYGLLGLSVFIGISAVVAVIINYIKKDDVEGTLFASHFRWQIRTFWFALLWSIIGWITLILSIGGTIIFVNLIWVIYRVVKGWLRLNDGKEMYT